jgi:site-specific DNA recombinase
VIRFAFKGRCSTEDQQDPEASRGWQLTRAKTLVEPQGGAIVAEYFDAGQSRSVPWQRRPQANALLAQLKIPNRGFDAVVIGEPQREFYGNQFGNTFPLFVHYGVPLWVPEVGGPIDPANEAHDLIMSVFGGMSKGERNRIKVRVRTAMAAQAQMEGRFLGGRPPYGYRLADAGPHPNPAKAADGRRLHTLEPDPVTAPVVERIFGDYLAGQGLYAIAQGLTRDGIACPSAHDRARNRHRSGIAWSKGAVRAILTNPRYTGRQVWNKQRKDEVLIDVDDVALGHQTRLRWNDPTAWVWSTDPAHPAIITADTYQHAQRITASHTRQTGARTPRPSPRPYALRGLLHCGLCHRRMQGNWNHGTAHYRCRYPNEYAQANTIAHPLAVYLKEADVLQPLDRWLAGMFSPHRLPDTVQHLYDAQDHPDLPDHREQAAQRRLTDCDQRLARYRHALEAGTDPHTIATWIAEVTTERAVAEAELSTAPPRRQKMTRHDIHKLITNLGDIAAALHHATADHKGPIYRNLGIHLTYQPSTRTVTAELRIDGHWCAYGACPRAVSTTTPTPCTSGDA